MCWTSVNTIQVYVFNVTVKLFLSIGVRVIFCQGGGKPFAQKIFASCSNFNKTVEQKGGPMQQHRPYWYLKMARYSFSESIPAKFEHKLRRHKQTFGKIATTVVLDKDENLL